MWPRRNVLPQTCGLEQVTADPFSAVGDPFDDRRGMAALQEVALPRSGSDPLALSEARRAWNRSRITPVSEIRCECARRSCRDRVPAVAETHRREADEFVVVPAHSGGVAVVRVADRFFVVESRAAVPQSSGEVS
jgi:hypothetical protein